MAQFMGWQSYAVSDMDVAPDNDRDDGRDEEQPEPTDRPVYEAGPASVFVLDDGRHLVSVEARHPYRDLYALPTLYEEVELDDEAAARELADVLGALAEEWFTLRATAMFEAVARYYRWMEADDASRLDTCMPGVRSFVEQGVRLSRESAERAERLAVSR